MRLSVGALRPFIAGLQKHSQIICGFGLGGLFMVTYLPQGIFAYKYKSVLELYKDGVPVGLDEKTKLLEREVLDTVYLKPEAEVDMVMIPCASPDPVHKGSCKLKGGTLIGLPANFKYQSEEDIAADRQRLVVGGKPLDWTKDASKKFAESLLLSDDAKRFVIAREIGYCNTWQVFNRPLLASAAFMFAYTLGFASNNLYNLRRRLPVKLRIMMYCAYGAMGSLFYLVTRDTYFCYLDRHSDRYAAQLGEKYARGGVEYYEKLLKRNQALRELLSDGHKHYTMYGNKVATWRQTEVPLVERLDILKAEFKKYDVEANDESEFSKITTES